MFDTHSNFGYGTVATPPTPGTSGTAIVLGTETFAQFPDPGTGSGYNCTVYPYGTIPLFSNAEIVRVVSKGTDGTIGVTRAQESTNNIDIQTGYQFAMTWTKKQITDIEGTASDNATNIASLQGSVGTIVSAPTDGWTPSSNTWTQSGTAQFLVAGTDVTARFPVGAKIKVDDNGTTKYFAVTSTSFSTNTTVNVEGGDDYSLAGTLTNPHYSYEETPQGYPYWFNFASGGTFAGFSSAPVVNEYKFAVEGRKVTCLIDFSGTSNAGSLVFSLPIAAAATGGDPDMPCAVLDNGAWQSSPGVFRVRNSAALVDVGKAMSSIAGAAYAGFTTSGLKGASILVTYKI